MASDDTSTTNGTNMSSLQSKLFIDVDSQGLDKRVNKITIVGCGAVGMACAFSILVQKVSNDVAIIDVQEDRLKGEMLDLQHGSYFMQSANIQASSDYKISANSKICIITAGARQKEGETRLDLVQRNVDILKGIIPKLVMFSPNTILLIVTNPVDILTQVAWKISGFPKQQVIGSGTNLDTLRLRYLLSKELNVAVESCHGWIIGEHGDTSVPVWSGVNIAGVRLVDIDPTFGTSSQSKRYQEMHKQVVNSAYDIIKLKGSTSWAIGLSVSQLCQTLLNYQGRIHAVSTLVKGLHGIEDEVFLSLPCVLHQSGVALIIKQVLTEDELNQLHNSAKTMKNILDGIKW
ncbi:lactate dehydrogenase isoform X2 [Lycorma delicatula]|uniref:lactate dehydrogenase isoform X2 n=1 Tax=Lycorma delicatula TaxID=130591 RepID=UPI003F50DB62